MKSGAKWVSTTLLPVSAASLGRLVGDISNPEADYEDTFRSSERPDGPQLVSTGIQAEAFQHDATIAKSWGLSLALTAVLGSTLSIEKSSVAKIDAQLVTTRKLSNSTPYFDRACQLGAVRDLLERRWRDRRKVFMVTGVMTLTNAHVTLRQGNKATVRPSIMLPDFVPMLGGVISLGLEVTHDEDHATNTLSFPGENIFAIQYRQVGFSWFRRPSQKTPSLKEGAEWKAYLGSRGEESDAECSRDDGIEDPGYETDEDEDEDADFVTLRAQVGGDIEPDDLGDLINHEGFGLDDGGEIWHIS
ncbi:hypothetical protein PT974_03679 [Cladobotryum mycophilum]|uniref:Uncharacterized protein n=1 Tax=Cladobotryum mycophilum TaxID=491253 RepID=A0ABR0ST38_9HYPO